MPEQAFYEKFSGWLVAGIASLLNILLFTWRKQTIKRIDNLDELLNELEEELKSKPSIQDVKLRLDENSVAHTRLFDKIDNLHGELNETRREIKSDIALLLKVVRNGNGQRSK